MKGNRSACWLLLLGLILAGAGCGKKGQPFVPQKSFTLRVVDLKAEWEGGYFLLSGRYDSPEGAKDRVSGCQVHYAEYPLEDPPCETCPVEFHGHHAFGAEVVQDQGFVCKVPGKKRGQVYFFKVHLIGMEGNQGPASNQVRISVNHP